MKKKTIKKLLQAAILPVLLILIGILLVFNPDSVTALVTKVVAWVLIICGGARLLAILVDREFYDIGGWIFAAMFLAAGMFFWCNPLILAKFIGVVLGVLLLLEGADGLRAAISLQKAGFSYLPGLILALVTLGAGCVLLFVPLTASRVAVSTSGVVLIVIGAGNLADRIRDMRHPEAPDESNIIDADV